MPREHTGHGKHHLPTTRDISTHVHKQIGQYQNQTDYIPCSQKQRNPIQSAKTRPEADCSSDHEFFFEKFRLKLKKVAHSDMT